MRKTPLNAWHAANGGKLVDFHGWEMPLQYSGIINEHNAVRDSVGIFDVSHMGEFLISGKDTVAFLHYITCNDVTKLEDGQAQYSAILTEKGTFIDDLTIYRFSETSFMACVNASNIDKDFAHFTGVAAKFDVTVKNASDDFALMAVQGKNAKKIMAEIFAGYDDGLKYYHFAEGKIADTDVILARMGYTGEDGFEVFVPSASAEKVWKKIMEVGEKHLIVPAGLGARDSLRTEVCYPLYGNDIDDAHNALEAGLGWIVKLKKDDFIGKQALVEAKAAGLAKKFVVFTLNDKGIPRPGQKLVDAQGAEAGYVTSGTFSSIINKGIGLGYLLAGREEPLKVRTPRRDLEITIQKPPLININK